MIPTIKRQKIPCANDGDIIRWVVDSKHGWDVCETFFEAIRYWLWNCGVPYRYVFSVVREYPNPEYYHPVHIEYIDREENRIKESMAWLAVDDYGHYIWTLEDETTVILDEDVLSWRHYDIIP